MTSSQRRKEKREARAIRRRLRKVKLGDLLDLDLRIGGGGIIHYTNVIPIWKGESTLQFMLADMTTVSCYQMDIVSITILSRLKDAVG